MELTKESKIIIKNNINWRKLESKTVVLNLDSGSYLTLNSTASDFWTFFDGNTTVENILNKMCSKYDVNGEEVFHDLKETISQLNKEGVVAVI